jgi:uncharacterized protein (TIGR02646 family)
LKALQKLPKPEILQRREDNWTAEYLEAVNGGTAKDHEHWRHAEIKETLRQELLGKCAYCEGFVEDVSYPHVEHILPKSVKPELAHRWLNLTSACGRCNVNKGEFYSEDAALLNPYVDDVDSHLAFLGYLVDWGLGSERGEVTVRTLDLNRADLASSRAKRLEAMKELLERWNESREPLRNILEDSIRLDAQEGEFSKTVVAYLRSFDFPI